MTKIKKAPKILSVKYLGGYILSLAFNTGETKEVDLMDFFCNSDAPFVDKFRDKKLFRKVKIDDGHLKWSDMMDLSAESLYTGEVGNLIDEAAVLS